MNTTPYLFFKKISFFLGLLFYIPYISIAQDCVFDDPQKQLEYEFLIELFNSNNSTFQDRVGTEWTQLVNGEICDLCDTERVVCNEEGYILMLLLSDFNPFSDIFYDLKLEHIPSSIINLKYLFNIRVDGNRSLKTLPESIGELSDLVLLQAEYCGLISLPESIGRLNNLEVLSINNNKLISLPDSLGYASSLERVDAQVNKITILPESIGNLTALRRGEFAGNRICAAPASIGSLDNVERFSMGAYIPCFPLELSLQCDNPTTSSGFPRFGIGGTVLEISFDEYCANPETYICPYYDTLARMPCLNELDNSVVRYGDGIITVFSSFFEGSPTPKPNRVEIVHVTNGADDIIVLCDGDCESVETMEGLPEGDYLVRIFNPSPDGSLACETDLSSPLSINSEVDISDGAANCGIVTFEAGDNQIILNGLTATHNKVEILGEGTNWQNLTICDGDCEETQLISNINAGNYTVKVQQLGNDGEYCYRDVQIEVGGENMSGSETTCDSIVFSVEQNEIRVSGLRAADNKIEIIAASTNWQNQTICDGNCNETQVINNLTSGNYTVKIQQWNEFGQYCYREETLNIENLTSDDNDIMSQSIYLVGFQEQKKVHLNWLTSSNKTAIHFLIERKTEETSFSPLTLVSLDNNQQQSSTWIDPFPANGINQYRIREVFANGSFSYSDVISIEYQQPKNQIGLFPNPTQSVLNLEVNDLQGETVDISLFNVYGQLIKTYDSVVVEETIYQLDLPLLENGLYWLNIQSDKRKMSSERFVVESGR